MAIIHVGFLTKKTLKRWGGSLLFEFREDGSRAQKLENRWSCLNSFVRGCSLNFTFLKLHLMSDHANTNSIMRFSQNSPNMSANQQSNMYRRDSNDNIDIEPIATRMQEE